MLDNFDCVVQAPTGSGKSLAFLIPTLELLLRKRKKAPPAEEGGCQILTVVVAPGRELVTQLWKLFSPLCKTLKMNALKLHGAGGKHKKRVQDPKKHFKGHCILITTPGRFEHYLEKESPKEFKQYLKHLEVLVIDEADRYSDRESMRSLTTLLSVLPKQRRTALFSATQATGIEQLVKFGLRNPIRLTMAGTEVNTDSTGFDRNEEKVGDDDEVGKAEHGKEVMPKELSNYYACVPAELKFLAMVNFLNSHKKAKVLVFVSNAAQAEYFALIVQPLLESKQARPVLSLHRKMIQARQKLLEKFRSTPHCVLFTTDLLARGVDVVGIDWVLQFDIPKLSKLFIHRCGRSGRMGHAGHSLVLLMDSERAYVQFMRQHEGVELKQYTKMDEAKLTEEAAAEAREQVQQMAIEDRKILELGSSAFVSYIEAYNRHDCQVICRVKTLDIVGVAHSFALLRLPRIREFQHRTDLGAFQTRKDVHTGDIPFKDPKLEAKRQAEKQKKAEEKGGEEKQRKGKMKSKRIKFDMKEEEDEESGGDEGEEIVNRNKGRKTKRGGEIVGKNRRMKTNRGDEIVAGRQMAKKRPHKSEWDRLQQGQSLLKKFKKGKLDRKQLDEGMDEL